MSETQSRSRLWILLLAAIVVGAVLLATRHRSLSWRLEVVGQKLDGTLSYYTWPQVLIKISPLAWREDLRGLAPDLVTLKSTNPEGPCPAVWDTPLGPLAGRLADQEYLRYFIDKWSTQDVSQALVKEGDVVLEIGAWVGTFTRYALHNGARLVVAFEPEPVNAACFEQSFEKEIREGRVIFIEAAAWDSAGSIRAQAVPPATPGENFSVMRAGDVEVQTVTVDSVVDRLHLHRLDLMHIDVEGAERRTLDGARQTISSFGPDIWMCTHHLPDDQEVLPRLVRQIRPSYKVISRNKRAFFFE